MLSEAKLERSGDARRGPGVRRRLLIAFLAISAFTVSAAAAGLYAFREVGTRLELVAERVSGTVAAVEISRSAERVIAAAPALLAAPDRARRDEIAAALARETARLDAALPAGTDDASSGSTLAGTRSLLTALEENLTTFESLVAQRLRAGERIGVLRRELLQINAALDRLLAPWLAVTDGEMDALLRRGNAVGGAPSASRAGTLDALVERQRSVQRARRLVASAVELLVEASTVDDARRLDVIEFQLGRALDALNVTAARLDARLRPLLLERVDALRALGTGPGSITATRRRELALMAAGATSMASARALSGRLGAAVERSGVAAGREVEAAVRDALGVQRDSARLLVALVALALASSLLIVRLYVVRRVTRPLSALADAMRAIAAGRLGTPVARGGDGEIAALGVAVETFRRNAIERDALLAERARTAERLEREVRERTAELEDSDAFKARFLAAASHDLRQPLHALNLFVAQLQDARASGERDRLVRRIDAAVGSMNGLCETLLDMSKLEAGVIAPQFDTFPIGAVLERLDTTFSEAARAKGLRFRVVPSEVRVRSDALLLERVLMNLVANAVRHTPHGSVLLGCRRRGGRLRIDVRDSGRGIPPERHAAVFDEFCRLAPEGPEHAGGLGFGLAIVERLATLLDCPVTLRSEPARGSCFSVSVPLAHGVDARLERSAPEAPLVDPLPGKLVVVIDDEEPVREATGGLLRRWGCEVLTAADAEAAVAGLAVRLRHADLLVSDCRLADGRSGIDAVSAVRRATGRATPAFLISGDTSPGLLAAARASGHPLVHKPLAPMTLRAVSSALLRSPPRSRRPAPGPDVVGDGP